MTLRSATQSLKDLLNVPPSSRGGVWASKSCGYSSDVLEAVGCELPDADCVLDDIIPLFKDVLDALGALPRGGGVFADKIDTYAANIAERIGYLEQYARKQDQPLRIGEPTA